MTNSVQLRLAFLSSAVLLALAASAAKAQTSTSIGMAYGGYFPMGGSLIREVGGVGGSPVPYPIFEKWQTGAVTLALRFTKPITSRISLQAKALHSPGRVSTRDSLNSVLEQSGYMSILSIRAPFQLTSPASGIVVQLSPGLGVTKRGGKAWQSFGRTTNPTAVLSLAFGGLLGRRSRWSSKIEIEDYFSKVQYNYSRWSPTERRFHHDFMLSVGFDYSFKRPRVINRGRR